MSSSTRVVAVDLAATSRNWALTPEGEARLRAEGPAGWEIRVVRAPTTSDGDGGKGPSAEALAAVRDAEVYFGFGISRPIFLAAPALRWAHSAAAGVGAALFPEMVASDVLLTNSAGIHAVPIAETVLGGLLHLVRSLDVAGALQRERRWDKQPFVGETSTMRELGDCRALVVGAGGIGQAIAERLACFGTRVTGIRRRPERGAPPGFARVVGPEALDAELPSADIVVLSAPATSETRALLDARRLALLPEGAIVVNVGRGTLLDEDALVAGLRSGRLRGAVLDVFTEEPLASDSPLWQLRQVVLTPHVSAVSPRRFWDRQLSLFLENWHHHVNGEPLRNLVDKRAGY